MSPTMMASFPLLQLLWRAEAQRPQRFQPVRSQRRVYAKGVSRVIKMAQEAKNMWSLKNRIRQKLLNPDYQPSSYDTAWVAMVPARGASKAPCFPGYVEWILQNQQSDGSWGLGHTGPCQLGKDAISCTLACILALKTWNLGDEHIRKGLHFIEENSSLIMDEKSHAPVGFNIIFSAMVKLGIELQLEFPLKQSDIDEIFRLREMELQRTTDGDNMVLGREAYMAYIAEGLADIMDWDKVLKYQSKNGSLFNSPSATAALAIHSHNATALKYLEFLENKFISSAPTAYPVNVHSQLRMIDLLENMGISSNFSFEIKNILDMTYRSFLQNDEDIIMNMETCGMAFRMLRMHGYDISSDAIYHFAEESKFHGSIEGYLNDTKALLELYNASLVCISEDELDLQNIGSWSGKLLKQQLCSNRVARSISPQEVEYALESPFYSATLEPQHHKRNIECFDHKAIQMRKTAYLACHPHEDILALATQDFHFSQSVYKQELEYINRWVKEAGLHQLKFARAMSWDVFIFMASTVFPSKLYDASIAWIQNCILTTIVDDFFDSGGSTEELKNFIALIEKWDAHKGIEFFSKDVEILFRAIYDTNTQIAAMGAEVQNRSVVDHIAEVWVDLVRAFMVEAEWTKNMHVPTMEEYIPIAEVSSALGPIVVPSLYLVGPQLSEDMIRNPEYRNLLWHLRICIRLLNDINTYKKEMSEGYINSILLHAFGDDGAAMSPASMEAAKREIEGLMVHSRRELLRLVLSEGGTIPRPCKDIFWNQYKIAQRFYSEGDGFSMPQKLVTAINAVVHEPLHAIK